MNAQGFAIAIREYGVALIFLNVLLERLGLPLPATPTLMVAGALAAGGGISPAAACAAALAAATVGDSAWFAAGRILGKRVLRAVCRISLAPDSCVRQSEQSFGRWGAGALVLAKFVPGLSIVARPLAGSMQVPWSSFTVLNGLGSLLWIGSAIGSGYLLHERIEPMLAHLAAIGGIALVAVAIAFLVYLAARWRQRTRFQRSVPSDRIDAGELRRLIEDGEAPLIVDLRSSIALIQDPRRIPQQLRIDPAELLSRVDHLSRHRAIVLYCGCPNEASAALAAGRLRERGFARAVPLRGGIEAWIEAGYPVEMGTGRPVSFIDVEQRIEASEGIA